MRIENSLPLEMISMGSTVFQCLGFSSEKRKIKVSEKEFTSLSNLTLTFPDLIHHPSTLARLANFLFAGNTFKVITDPQKFLKIYFFNVFPEPEEKTFLSSVFSPRFVGNSFLFFAWNQINDRLYLASCVYPFNDEFSDIKYELYTAKSFFI